MIGADVASIVYPGWMSLTRVASSTGKSCEVVSQVSGAWNLPLYQPDFCNNGLWCSVGMLVVLILACITAALFLVSVVLAIFLYINDRKHDMLLGAKNHWPFVQKMVLAGGIMCSVCAVIAWLVVSGFLIPTRYVDQSCSGISFLMFSGASAAALVLLAILLVPIQIVRQSYRMPHDITKHIQAPSYPVYNPVPVPQAPRPPYNGAPVPAYPAYKPMGMHPAPYMVKMNPYLTH